MAQRRPLIGPIVTVIIAVLVVLIALPSSMRTWMPGFLQSPQLHLGLDLAGGTQLDFRISEEEINSELDTLEKQVATLQSSGAPIDQINLAKAQIIAVQAQKANIVEAIRTVLEKRINGLGVSEATITPSYIGSEKHLLVECPGVVDIQECIKVVGKTIQLEFKEEFTTPTEEFKKEVRTKVAATVARLTQSGSTLDKEGQDLGASVGGYQKSATYFRDELPKGMEDLWSLQPGPVLQREGSTKVAVQQDNGQVVEEERPGIFLTQVLRPLTQTGRTVNEAPRAFQILQKEEAGSTYTHQENLPIDDKVDAKVAAALREMRGGELRPVAVQSGAKILFLRGRTAAIEQMDVSHILVSFKGASQADATVSRTKEQALARAQDLAAQLAKGANFADLARRESDGPSKREGGKLGTITRGQMAPAFEQTAFALTQNQVSNPVETQFGFHIIRADAAPSTKPAVADVDVLTLAGTNAAGRADELIKKMQNGEVKITEPAITLRTLFFSLVPTGWKETALDGKHFQHASVTLDSVTGVPVVQIVFDAEGARLFQEITKRNIGKRIAIFVGGEQVTAPRVQNEISGGIAVITGSSTLEEAQKVSQDLNTGAIPAPIYLTGQYTVEATLGAEALYTSLFAAFVGLIVLMIYMVVVYRLLGLVACAGLLIYAFLLATIVKLPLFLITNNYIVLTLAGISGIILSLGMAIDANVLVFERLKEELRKGRSLRSAVEGSFKYAWPAIRDGNAATLITCLVLFLFGSSIVRGFAITLSMGILLSVFTAVTVTRFFIRKLMARRLSSNPVWYGLRPGEAPQLKDDQM